jgi:hypothetical protein
MTTRGDIAAALQAVLDDPALIEAGRLEVEDTLVEFRDSAMWEGFHNNGLTIKNRDGSPSEIIRMGPAMGIGIALRGIIKKLEVADGVEE